MKGSFVGVKQLLNSRFFNYKSRAFRQSFVDVYDHCMFRSSLAEAGSCLRRWSGKNRYTTDSSWLYLVKCGNLEKIVLEYELVRDCLKNIFGYKRLLIPKFGNK